MQVSVTNDPCKPRSTQPAFRKPGSPPGRARRGQSTRGLAGEQPLALVVEDDPDAATVAISMLQILGFDTRQAADAQQALSILASTKLDLVVLDIMLPGMSGLDVLRDLRESKTDIRVIVLTALADESDVVRGFEFGADDYMAKPFSPREIVARARAVLRRAGTGAVAAAPAPGIRVDGERRQAWAGAHELALSRTEFDLLATFAGAPGRVFERETLLDRVWGPTVAVTERTVDVHIKSLRKKLVAGGLPADTIETVRGVGYRLAVS